MNKTSQSQLTRCEAEILRLAATGLPSQEIADRLFVSKRTVDFHLHNIYDKLQVTNRLQAIIWGTQQGICSLPQAG